MDLIAGFVDTYRVLFSYGFNVRENRLSAGAKEVDLCIDTFIDRPIRGEFEGLSHAWLRA